MISIVFWVAVGMTTGWITAIMREEKGPWLTGTFIIVGAAGGLAGGLGGAAIATQGNTYSTGPTDIMFAVFGALTLVLLATATMKRVQQ